MHLSRNIQKPLPSKESKEIAPKKPVGNKNLQQSGVAEKRGSTAVQNAHAQASPALAKGSTTGTKKVSFSPNIATYYKHQSPNQIKKDMPSKVAPSDSTEELQNNTACISEITTPPSIGVYAEPVANHFQVQKNVAQNEMENTLAKFDGIPTSLKSTSQPPSADSVIAAREEAALKKLDEVIEQGLRDLDLRNDLHELPAFLQGLQEQGESYTEIVASLKVKFARIFDAYMPKEFGGSIDSEKLLLLAGDLKKKETISQVNFQHIGSIAKFMKNTEFKNKMAITTGINTLSKLFVKIENQGSDVATSQESLKIEIMNFLAKIRPNVPKSMSLGYDNPRDLLFIAGQLQNRNLVSEVEYNLLGEVAKFMKRPIVEATAPVKPTAPVGVSSVPSAPPLTADEFAILSIIEHGNSAGPSRFNGIKKVPDYGAAQRIALNKGSEVALGNFIAKLPPKIGPTELAAAAKSLYQRGKITQPTANALIALANRKGVSKPLYVPVSPIQ